MVTNGDRQVDIIGQFKTQIDTSVQTGVNIQRQKIDSQTGRS